jgi:CRISPR-associated protein Csx3
LAGTYTISIEGDVMTVAFGVPGTNSDIVKDATTRLQELKDRGELKGGALLKINGAASLPCAFVLSHGVGHLYGAIGVWDPKLKQYVISISHTPDYKIGNLID